MSETPRFETIKKPHRRETTTSIQIEQETRLKLNALKALIGFRSYGALLNYCAIAVRDIHEDAIEPASYEEIFVKLAGDIESRRILFLSIVEPTALRNLTYERSSSDVDHIIPQVSILEEATPRVIGESRYIQ